MLNCLSEKTTMSLNKFLNNDEQLEKFASKIKLNKKLEKATIILIALVLNTKSVMAAGKGIDPLGIKLLGLVRHWAYWILLIMCIVEVIRAGVGGDSKKILSIIMRYLLIFMSMYLVPELFDAIQTAF